MKNKKVILSSILSLVLCLSLIAGGTFALFTSTTKTNIAVTSGNVEVVAWLDDIETSTFGTAQAENTFELGGTATYDSTANKLTVDKIAPGDRVDLNVYIENKSNISVKYRVKVAFAGELQDALVASITLPGDKTATVLTAADVATGWNSFDETNKVVLPMSVELPYDVGNDYMNKSAEIIVTVEAVQANATELVMIENTKYASLDDAIAAAEDGATIGLSGVFTLPTDDSLKGRTLTFKSIEDSVAVFNMKKVATGQSTSDAALTFDGVDLVFDNNANYMGIQHAAAVIYNNCTITGKQFMYADTVAFNKCELVNYTDYCVWTYGTDATFTDCTFTTGGKAIYVYNEGTTDDTVTVTNCTFNSNGQTATDKAAVETGINTLDVEAAANSKHTLVINNSTANGFAANKSTSPLWGNKNNMDGDHLSVTVDGVVQDIVLEWDGSVSAVSEPVEKEINGETVTVVEINTPAELAGLAAAVNAGTTYEGVTVVLAEDMDLKGIEWTPMGSYSAQKYFKGTLDGQGHTVSNLVAGDGSTNDQGFIGASSGAVTVKNITFNNADIQTNGRGAVVIGHAVTGAVTLENITVTGDVKIEGKTQVGTVIGSGANANYTASNITVDVNEGSYVSSAKNTDGRYFDYAGGVFGQVWGSSFTNITSNIDVIGCWAYGVGGITGGASGTWENITCTGDVTILNKDTNLYYTNTNPNGNAYGDVYEWQCAGLISGHHNTVTFKNCVATGTLTYVTDNTTTNGMYFFNTDGEKCEDNRFGATRYKNDNNVTIVD